MDPRICRKWILGIFSRPRDIYIAVLTAITVPAHVVVCGICFVVIIARVVLTLQRLEFCLGWGRATVWADTNEIIQLLYSKTKF